MILQRNNAKLYLETLKKSECLGLDVETYGLSINDRLFGIGLSDGKRDFYLNFKHYPGIFPIYVLPYEMIHDVVSLLTSVAQVFGHNISFDMLKILSEGGDISRVNLRCTKVGERLLCNNRYEKGAYTLASTSQRYNKFKIDSVEEYIKEHKLYDKKLVYAKKEKEFKYYDKVPLDLIAEYCKKDARLALEIGLIQQQTLLRPQNNYTQVYENESDLIKVLVKMKFRGIRLDYAKVYKSLQEEKNNLDANKKLFQVISGHPFVDSPKSLAEAFDANGYEYERNAKTSRACFDKDSLKKYNNPLVPIIKKIRLSTDLIGKYYEAYMHYSVDDVIHADFDASGTTTGRFSSSSPNMQNIPKKESDEKEIHVRDCFIPRDGYIFAMLDYDQQEYRMMLDYAGETKLINKVLDGMDVHTATAELLGIDRNFAKTINFGLLYGMGAPTLAKSLGVSLSEATRLRNLYFSRLPHIKDWIQNVRKRGETRGYVFGWMGRRSYASKDKCYKLPNHIIQGGCADVVKSAMVKCDAYLQDKKSAMLVQIHDEILFEIHKDEIKIIPRLKDIMEGIYKPKNGMKLTCSVEHSYKSWGLKDRIVGCP